MAGFFEPYSEFSTATPPIPWPWTLRAFLLLALVMGFGKNAPWCGLLMLVVMGLILLAGLAGFSGLRLDRLAWDWSEALILKFTLGLGIALCAWLGSGYLTKHLWPGTCVLGAAAVWGFFIWRRRGGTLSQLQWPEALGFWLVVAALSLGIYHGYWIEDITIAHVGFHGDWITDLLYEGQFAALIQEQGLPLVDPTGSGAFPFQGPHDIGAATLMAGVENATQLGLFQAARFVIPMAYAVLVLYGFALVKKADRPLGVVILASGAALIWGGLSLPVDLIAGNRDGLLNPYSLSLFRPNLPAGTLYHHQPQLLAVVFLAAGVIALRKHMEAHALAPLGVAAFLFGLTLMFKSPVFVVCLPALLLVVVFPKFSWSRLGLTLGVLSLTTGLYYLPWVYSMLTPDKNTWAMRWLGPSPFKLAAQYGITLGIAWVYLALQMKELGTRWRELQPPQVGDFLALGLFFGLIFSLFFFEPSRPSHNNQYWGLSAMLVLAAPHIVVQAYAWFRQASPRKLAWGIPLLVGLQLTSGLIFAGHYPFGQVYKYERNLIAAYQVLRQVTRPGTKFLVDENYRGQTWVAAYLARPLLKDFNSNPHALRQVDQWQKASARQADILPFLKTHDAVILGPTMQWLVPQLQTLGWKQVITILREWDVWVRREMLTTQSELQPRDASPPMPLPR